MALTNLSLFLACMMMLSLPVAAQPGKPQSTNITYVETIQNSLLPRSDSIYNAMAQGKFDVPRYTPSKYPVTSNCMVNGETTLHFSDAIWRDDTLRLLIYEKTTVFVHTVEVTIAGDQFQTTYEFHLPDSVGGISVEATDQLLLLTSKNYEPGNTLKGFLNFRGTVLTDPKTLKGWSNKEDWVESKYLIKGAFKVQIR